MEGEDAFQRSWTDTSLWINPPFDKIGQVVTKVAADGAHAILVVPGWARRRWHRAAASMAIRRLIYPRGTRLFERAGEVCRGCPWPVTAFLLCGHQPRCEGGVLQKTLEHVRFGLRCTSPPPGTRGALGTEGVRRAHLGQVSGILKPMSQIEPRGESIVVTSEWVEDAPKELPEVHQTPENAPENSKGERPPRMLDLFSGTGSIGRVYRELGYEVTSLDMDPQWGGRSPS